MNLRPLAISLSCLVTLARCAGTETDNPVTETGAPEYRSPVRFEPEPQPTPPCSPPDGDLPPGDLPLWGQTGRYLVGAGALAIAPGGGLVVVDVSEPAAPRIVGELPLEGYPRQLVVDGDSATLLIDELAMYAGSTVPGPEALAPKTRLVRFDLSQPEAPARIAEQPLEGEVWQMLARDGALWVLSARLDPTTLRCEVEPHPCGFVSREAMIASRYDYGPEGLVLSDEVALPAGSRAWLLDEGFATAVGHEDASATLHFAAFAPDGSLLPSRTVNLGAPVVRRSPLYLGADRIGVFVYDLTEGSAALSVLDHQGDELARVAGLSQGLGEGTRFVRDTALVSSSDVSVPAVLIDFSDVTEVRRTTLNGASSVVPLAGPGAAATRALGWTSDMNRNDVRFSLWALEAGGAQLLDELPAPGLSNWSPDIVLPDGERVLFFHHAEGALLTSVSHDGDALSLEGTVDAGYAHQLLGVADWVYGSDGSFANPRQGNAAVPIRALDEAVDVVALDDGQATLLRTWQGEWRVEVLRGGARESITLADSAQRLLAAGNRVVVVRSEPLERSLTLVATDPLRVVSELSLPALTLPPLGPASRAEELFAPFAGSPTSPVRLDESHWLLESELSLTCGSPEDCAALGIEPGPVGGNVAMTDCGPVAPECEQPPAPTVQGTARRRAFRVLDAANATIAEPMVIDVERGTPFDHWLRPFVSGGTLLDLHLDPPYRGPLRAAPPSAQFWLERYELDGAGALQPLPAINIPGYPIALLPDGSLLSVEASLAADATAELYHSRIRGEGVEVVARRSVGARHGGARVVGQTLLHVRVSPDPCDPVTQLETYALDAELTPLGALELAGEGWRILDATGDDTVLLASPDNRSFARVGIVGAPVLAGFATAPGYLESPSVLAAPDKNAVLGVSEGTVVQISP